MANITDKIEKWKDFLEKSTDFWEESMENFLGFALDFSSESPPSDPTPAQSSAHANATTLASQLSHIVLLYEMERPLGDGDVGTLACQDGCVFTKTWPKEDQYDGSGSIIESFHDTVLAPLVLEIAQYLKELLDNPLMSNPDLITEVVETGSWFSDDALETLPQRAEAVMLAAADYLDFFSEYSFSLKKDIPSAATTAGLGPSPISSDPDLEKSLNLSGTPHHYIGLLLNEEKSAGKRSKYYLPVRTSPFEEGLEAGWDDPKYSLISSAVTANKMLVPSSFKDGNNLSDGIDLPLGTEVVVTEIINSMTGMWVGFIPAHHGGQSIDPDAAWDSGIEDDVEDYTDDYKRVLYTRPEFLRIKEAYNNPNSPNYSPDPFISHKTTNSENADFKPRLPAGFEEIKPATNQNWLGMEPEDVVLTYFSFNEHNKDIAEASEHDLTYEPHDIEVRPSHRYSEGYFYFVVGESHIPTEEEIAGQPGGPDTGTSAMEDIKQNNYTDSIREAKDKAWGNLLFYLGKNTVGGNVTYRNKLKNEYFVKAGSKMSNSGVNPNHKVIFAIRASYVDSLPETRKPYGNDFPSNSPFIDGNNFAVSFHVDELVDTSDAGICGRLARVLSIIKEKKDESLRCEDRKGLHYDIDTQINLIKEMPTWFKDFFSRQGYPASTDKDSIIGSSCRRAGDGEEGHIVQIGMRDNGQVGEQVRNTLSYMLFSPSPESLKNIEDPEFKDDLGLFYFDPYLTSEQAGNNETVDRSAVPLRIGISVLRERFAGRYGSRALHYLMAYHNIITFQDAQGDSLSNDEWIDFLTKYTVPPVYVYPSTDPASEAAETGDTDCAALIEQLNQLGPTAGYEEQVLQEKIFNNPECAKLYRDQWKDSTPATDPETSKESIQDKLDQSEASDFEVPMGLKRFYRIIMSHIDVDSIVALIIACISKQLGIGLTAEELCRAAIIKLIESMGLSEVEKTILANALLDPENKTYQQVMDGMSTNPYGASIGHPDISLNASFNGAPIAASLKVLADEYAAAALEGVPGLENTTDEKRSVQIVKEDGTVELIVLAPGGTYILKEGETGDPTYAATIYPPGATPDYLTAIAIMAIKNFEKSGGYVELVPGRRPQAISSGGTKQIQVSSDFSGNLAGGLLNAMWGDNIVLNDRYTQEEIDTERNYLINIGYSTADANALLVQKGYLEPKSTQFSGLLGDGGFFDQVDKELEEMAVSPELRGISSTARNAVDNAEAWLEYMERFSDLQTMCELIVGPLLEGFEDLLSDPVGFFAGGGGTWFDSFIDQLKRMFSTPTMKLSFPDNLMTDNHMGNYTEALVKAAVMMIGMIIGQVINLVLKHFLEKCLEEAELDQGPVANPFPETPPIDIPNSALPNLAGIPLGAVSDWLNDTMENLSPAQLCSLLRGDASTETLRETLKRMRAFPDVWHAISGHSTDEPTLHEVRAVFKEIGSKVDISICDLLQISSPAITNVCDAVYDVDAKAKSLEAAGLTREQSALQANIELEDLKAKLASVAGLSSFGGLFESNHLLKAFPPMCAEGGGFTVPPGMDDTMRRVTENYLTHIKSSLILDLNALKFFSVTPKAVLAANDPEELKEVHKTFVKPRNKPNLKLGMAFIGDPNKFDVNTGRDDKNWGLPNYGMAYNKHMHYKLFIKSATAGDGGDKSEGTNQVWDSILGTGPIVERGSNFDLPLRTKQYLGQYGYKMNNSGDHYDLNYFMPITVGDFLEDPRFYMEYNVMIQVVRHIIVSEFELTDQQRSSIGQIGALASEESIAQMIEWLQENDFVGRLKDKIRSAFHPSTEVKPVWMASALVDPKTFVQWDAKKTIMSIMPNPLDMTQTLEDPDSVASLPGPSTAYVDDGMPDWWPIEGRNFLRNRRPLNMKLKDIYGNPMAWAHMFKMYTGVNINKFTGYRFGGWPIVLENDEGEGDVYQEIWGGISPGHIPAELDDEELVVETWAHPSWPADPPHGTAELKPIEASDAREDKDENANRQWNSTIWRGAMMHSPGMVKVFEIAERQYRDRVYNAPTSAFMAEDLDWDGPLEDECASANKWDLLYAFMELTVAEACGLTDERISELYPNFPPAKTLHSVLFTAVRYVDVDVLETVMQSPTADQLQSTIDAAIDTGDLNLEADLENLGSAKERQTCFETCLESNFHPTELSLEERDEELEREWLQWKDDYEAGLTDSPPPDFPEKYLGHNNEEARTEYTKEYEEMVEAFCQQQCQYDDSSANAAMADFESPDQIASTLRDPNCRWGFVPLYVIFMQPIRDPDSLLSKGPQAMIDHFSDKERPINPQIYKYLINEQFFPQSLGFTDSYFYDTTSINAGSAHILENAANLETYDNFNPNILKYDFPYTSVMNQRIEGWSGNTIIDGPAKTEELLTIFNNNSSGTPVPAQIKDLLSQLETSNKNRSLIYQNVSVPLITHLAGQASAIRDNYRAAKGKILDNGEYSVPPGPLGLEESMRDEMFDFNFFKEMRSDIQDLLKDIYGTQSVYQYLTNPANYLLYKTNPHGNIIETADGKTGEIISSGLIALDPGASNIVTTFDTAGRDNPYRLDPLNFKAKIFGDFLTHKFMQKYEQYSSLDQAGVPYPKEKFKKFLRFILSSYGYTGLQFAYSNQMFSKMKRSRLHKKGFMRQLWNKILKTSLTKETKGKEPDPHCLDIFGRLSFPDAPGLKQTETDFFNLDNVKNEIHEFYRRSLCRDVYDNDSLGDLSVKRAVLQGTIKLLLRVYTLEMCLASVIAWDSFEVSDIIKNDILVNIILKNIGEDVNVDTIARLAEDMYRKDQELTEEQYVLGKKNQSALEFFIREEADKVSEIIKSIFNNSSPITTGLNLDIISNSDPDFIERQTRALWHGLGVPPSQTTPLASTYDSAALYNNMGPDAEVITNTQFQKNIYTMNYAAGVPPRGYANKLAFKNPDAQLAGSTTKLFGHAPTAVWTRFDIARTGVSKTLFHSLPYTHYTMPVEYDSNGNIINPYEDTSPPVPPGPYPNAADYIPADIPEPEYVPDTADPICKEIAQKWNKDSGLPSDHTLGYTMALTKEECKAQIAHAQLTNYWKKKKYEDQVEAHYEQYEAAVAEWTAVDKEFQLRGGADGLEQYNYESEYWNKHVTKPGAGNFGSSYFWTPQGTIDPESPDKLIKNHGDFPFRKFLTMMETIGDPTSGVSEESKEFKRYIKFQKALAEGATAFDKENWSDIQYGNNLNAKLGNVTFQPYVKVEDWPNIQDLLNALKDRGVTIYQQAKGDPFQIEPCDDPYDTYVQDLNDQGTLQLLEDFLKELNGIRKENNIFKSYIFEYVPLSVWSYFYTHIFLKILHKAVYAPLLQFYQVHGWIFFFKKIKFGVRLSYSTSYPIIEAEDLQFTEYMQRSFSKGLPPAIFATGTRPDPAVGLKRCKTVIGQRPYVIKDTIESLHTNASDYIQTIKEIKEETDDRPPTGNLASQGAKRYGGVRVLNEIQIPIVEVEREIQTVHPEKGVFSFTIGKDKNLFSVDELGWRPPQGTTYLAGKTINSDGKPTTKELMNNPHVLKHLSNTTDRFFYKHVASNLMSELKETPEFKLMYDHLFPQERYMVMAFMFAGEGLSKFIPEPTNVLDETKRAILRIMDTLNASDDYTEEQVPFELILNDLLTSTESDTRGKSPSLLMQILMIILKTPLYILKGFVEITDPAIILAKSIIDVANAIHTAAFAAIETGLMISKAAMQMTIGSAKVALVNLQVNVEMSVNLLQSAKAALPEDVQSLVVICTNNEDEGCTGDDIPPIGGIKDWVMEIKDLPEGIPADPPDGFEDTWESFKEQFTTAKDLLEEFGAAAEALEILEQEFEDFEKYTVETIARAKQQMKDVLTSPYLLPGLWAAMIPSMTPYWGGLMPPPLPGGPPSTIPGMIYLLLMFLDAWEEFQAQLADEDAVDDNFSCDDLL